MIILMISDLVKCCIENDGLKYSFTIFGVVCSERNGTSLT